MVRIIPLGARIILGLIYFVFGSMGLAIALGLMPMPNSPMPEAATAFMTGIMASGYFFPLLKVTEVVCGFLILTGFAAPVHILLFHVFLTPGGSNLVMPLVMVLTQVIAMSAYWNLYRPLFSKKIKK